MDEEMVSLQAVREHYGIWRWKIEREYSNKLVKIWAEIAASSVDNGTKTELANVAWALASFAKASDVLLEDIVRAERAKNTGVPPVMKFLTGPHEDSLEYLLGMSLWMDLADVLVSYRMITERFGHLKRSARRNKIPMAVTDIEREIQTLEARRLPELSTKPATALADTVLHETWHPSGALTLNFELYWKGTQPKRLDFASGDFRESLDALVANTLKQVYEFILAVLQRHAAGSQYHA